MPRHPAQSTQLFSHLTNLRKTNLFMVASLFVLAGCFAKNGVGTPKDKGVSKPNTIAVEGVEYGSLVPLTASFTKAGGQTLGLTTLTGATEVSAYTLMVKCDGMAVVATVTRDLTTSYSPATIAKKLTGCQTSLHSLTLAGKDTSGSAVATVYTDTAEYLAGTAAINPDVEDSTTPRQLSDISGANKLSLSLAPSAGPSTLAGQLSFGSSSPLLSYHYTLTEVATGKTSVSERPAPPTLIIVSPHYANQQTAPAIALSGSCSVPGQPILLTVDAAPASTTPASILCKPGLSGGTWSGNVDLSAGSITEGQHTLGASITDLFSQTVSKTVTITKDTTPPIIKPDVPSASFLAGSTSQVVSGTCESGLAVNLTVFTVKTIPCSIGTYSTTIDTSAVVDNTLVSLAVSQTDAAGNSTSAATSFTKLDAPVAPSGLVATAGNATSTISWAAVPGSSSYNIYWSNAVGVATSSSVISGVNSAYTHNGLTNGLTYYYKVAAVNQTGTGLLSSEVSASPTQPPPAAPASVAVSAGYSRVNVSWSLSSGATSYNLYWNTSAGVTKSSNKIAGVTTTYSHTGLTNAQTYYYALTAVGPGGESTLSTEYFATPTVPAPPVKPPYVALVKGDSQVSVAWPSVAGADGYKLYWNTTPGSSCASSYLSVSGASTVSSVPGSPGVQSITVPGQAVTSYVHTGLTNGQCYMYTVTAYNDGGESAYPIQRRTDPITSASIEFRRMPYEVIGYHGASWYTPSTITAAADGRIYVGDGNSTIYESEDGGQSWASYNNTSIRKILINGSYMYTATTSGLYRSADQGYSWTQKAASGLSVLGLAATGSNVYATTQEYGLYISHNNFDSYTTSTTATSGGLCPCYYRSLSLVNAATPILYINGYQKSTDESTSWTNIGSPGDPTFALDSFAAGTGSSAVVMMATNDNGGKATNGLTITVDGGASFIQRKGGDGSGLPGSNVVRAVADGANGASTKIWGASSQGAFMSTNAGNTFTPLTKAVNGISDDTNISDIFYLGGKVYATGPSGVSISTNGGSSFSVVGDTTAYNSSSLDIAVEQTTGDIFSASSAGLSVSRDGGLSFTLKTTADGLGGSPLGVATGGSLVVVASLGGISVSTNKASSFLNLAGSGGVPALATLSTTSPFSKPYIDSSGVIYVITTLTDGTTQKLLISTDSGQSFTTKDAGQGFSATMYQVAVDSSGYIYIATKDGLAISNAPGGAALAACSSSCTTLKTTTQGLPSSNVIKGVFLDETGRVYARNITGTTLIASKYTTAATLIACSSACFYSKTSSQGMIASGAISSVWVFYGTGRAKIYVGSNLGISVATITTTAGTKATAADVDSWMNSCTTSACFAQKTTTSGLSNNSVNSIKGYGTRLYIGSNSNATKPGAMLFTDP